jgi:hypothetical protein
MVAVIASTITVAVLVQRTVTDAPTGGAVLLAVEATGDDHHSPLL